MTYTWNFGDGTPAETSRVAEIRHVFMQTGKLTISLEIANTFEKASHQFPVDVYEQVILGSLAATTAPPLTSQVPIDFALALMSGSNVAYQWFVNDAKRADTTDPRTSITFSHAGSYQVSVVASNAFSSEKATTTVVITAQLTGNLFTGLLQYLDKKSGLRKFS